MPSEGGRGDVEPARAPPRDRRGQDVAAEAPRGGAGVPWRWLDIYSPSPGPKIVAVVLIATGAWLLARLSLSGALPIALLVWSNRARFLATLAELADRHRWVVVALPLAVVVARVAWPAPAAPDDLLRHIAVAFWPGGYADMYVGSSLPAVNLYPLFDAAVGALARAFGPPAAMWATQGTAFALFVAVLLGAARLEVAGRPDARFLLLAVLLLTLGSMLPRVMLGRPEMFLTIWALAACLARGSGAAVAWVAAGAILNAVYWLSPVYFPAALLLGVSRRARAAAFLALCASWLALWGWLAGAELVPTMLWQFRSMASWAPGVMVGENRSIAHALAVPMFWPLLAAALWGASRGTGRREFLWLALWFALSNQIRYIGVIAPLLALYAASALPHRDWTKSPAQRLGAIALGLMVAAAGMPAVHRYHDLPRFDLPPGAVVFTPFDVSTYSLPFHNPGRIRVAPSFALGALDPELQVAVRDLVAGRLDCALLQERGFTHLVERTARGDPPGCAHLAAIDGPTRLWRLQSPATR
jgi:hypothetical protein